MSNEKKTDKGKKGGSCNRTACQKPGAEWYNHATESYYCTACAHEINRVNPEAQKMYGHPLCTREQPQEGKPMTAEEEQHCGTHRDIMVDLHRREMEHDGAVLSFKKGFNEGYALAAKDKRQDLADHEKATAALREDLEKVKEERNKALNDYSSLQFSNVQDKRRHLKELEAVKQDREKYASKKVKDACHDRDEIMRQLSRNEISALKKEVEKWKYAAEDAQRCHEERHIACCEAEKELEAVKKERDEAKKGKWVSEGGLQIMPYLEAKAKDDRIIELQAQLSAVTRQRDEAEGALKQIKDITDWSGYPGCNYSVPSILKTIVDDYFSRLSSGETKPSK